MCVGVPLYFDGIHLPQMCEMELIDISINCKSDICAFVMVYGKQILGWYSVPMSDFLHRFDLDYVKHNHKSLLKQNLNHETKSR